jgi:hypothetical protein
MGCMKRRPIETGGVKTCGENNCMAVNDNCEEMKCSHITNSELCETNGVVLNEKCFWEDNFCNKEEDCEHYSNEECLKNTRRKCVPTLDGCRC